MTSPRAEVVVVDYGVGNLQSVANALEWAGARPLLSDRPKTILNARALVLPGVGAAGTAMKALAKRGLVKAIKEYTASGRPLLCICLGMQLLMDYTEEGDASCLGIIPGKVRKLPSLGPMVKLPHMGWNQVKLQTTYTNMVHPTFLGMPNDSYFYFAHSYFIQPVDRRGVLGTTLYGIDPWEGSGWQFCSVYARDKLVATQFHPEKSGAMGLKIYRNFVTGMA